MIRFVIHGWKMSASSPTIKNLALELYKVEYIFIMINRHDYISILFLTHTYIYIYIYIYRQKYSHPGTGIKNHPLGDIF